MSGTPSPNVDSVDLQEVFASSQTAAENPQVTRALEEYLQALEAGERPDRSQFLARFPEAADVLADCLEGLEFLHQTAAHLSPSSAGRPAPAAANLPDAEKPPLRDYHIIREVGRGGMGIVYEAVQRSLHRRVALKVLSVGATLDPRHRLRFQNEAQAAAQLQHPNIVPVFAFGCEEGVHYYSMRFIDGETLGEFIQKLRNGAREANGAELIETDFLDDLTTPFLPGASCPSARRSIALPTSPSRSVDCSPARGDAYFRLAAWMGVQAAEALEHAHQMGVVHRDVKPANLLLDREGRLWVADFGLARCSNDANLTGTGDMLGTLRYMSPEQASARRGLVDHRTDVYSLGATLYELLTLQPVFLGDDQGELFQRILEDDPTPLRRLCADIPRDLETIVLKSLNKQVEDRYATAKEQADDLRRFLEGRPILARRPTMVEQTARWARRHHTVVASVAALLLLSMLGLLAGTIAVSREKSKTEEALKGKEEALKKETAARELAERNYELAKDNFELAQKNYRQARNIVDYIAEIAAVDMAAESDVDNVRHKLLLAAHNYYKDFIAQQGDDRRTRQELLRSKARVANILDAMGRPKDAEFALNQALSVLVNGDGEDDSPRVQAVLAAPDWSISPRPKDDGRRKGIVVGGQATMKIVAADSPLRLLRLASVQKDLKLTMTQVQAALDSATKWNLEMNGTMERKQNQTNQEGVVVRFEPDKVALPGLKRLAIDEKMDEQAVRSLTLAQGRRLHQLLLQQQGIRAFQDESVIAELDLTPKQRGELDVVLEKAQTMDGSQDRGGEQRSMQIALNVLTPVQRSKWRGLVGEPFQGKLPPSNLVLCLGDSAFEIGQFHATVRAKCTAGTEAGVVIHHSSDKPGKPVRLGTE